MDDYLTTKYKRLLNGAIEFQKGDKETYLKFLKDTVFPSTELSLALAIGYSAVVVARLKDEADLGTVICIATTVRIELSSPKTFWIQGVGAMFEIINEVDFSEIYEEYALQEYDRTLLIQAYEEKYPQAGKATILHYCGTYESGAIVAMLAGSDEGFDCAEWTETVADYDFNYSNGNRISVLYSNEFYTLTKAYENGYLTKENIADIHIKWDRE